MTKEESCTAGFLRRIGIHCKLILRPHRETAKQGKAICSERDLNSLLAVDLSSGFIWVN